MHIIDKNNMFHSFFRPGNHIFLQIFKANRGCALCMNAHCATLMMVRCIDKIILTTILLILIICTIIVSITDPFLWYTDTVTTGEEMIRTSTQPCITVCSYTKYTTHRYYCIFIYIQPNLLFQTSMDK